RESLFLPGEPGESVVEVLVCTLERLRGNFLEPRMFFFKGGKTVVQVETGEVSTFLLIRPDFLLQRMVVHKPTGMDVFHEEREPAPLKDTSDTYRRHAAFRSIF
ncbi:MAG: hypothetical protein WBI30_10455, partial [Candidatus Methanoculleus thermohydrogenotrophicum]